MDEDPKQHDFDQRHDGPFDQPRPSASIPRNVSIQIPNDGSETPTNPTTAKSHTDPLPTSTPTAPEADSLASASSPPPRKSVQLSTKGSYVDLQGRHVKGRKSTGGGRPRPSQDFDIRRDGPYGRPSLTMSRRKSSTPAVLSEPLQDVEDTDPERPTTEMLNAETVVFEPEPPPLNYSLWTRRWSIIFFWSLIVIDCIAMPVGLYFGLWYGTDLSPNIVFSIVTAALGGVSIMEYFIRFWRLWKKGSNCRVIGARRMYLDWFHWNFTLGWVIIMVELIVGTIPDNPPIRLLAMPVASMMYAFGTELLVVDALRFFQIPAPVRISSIPKGAQLRPAIYSIIEDVCAVDGSGGTEYREALNRRYEASHVFRAMLRRLGAFWAFGAEGMAVIITILVFTIQHEAAYVVGWTVPFVWAGVWTLITYFYVVRKLREEKRAWADEIAEKGILPTV